MGPRTYAPLGTGEGGEPTCTQASALRLGPHRVGAKKGASCSLLLSPGEVVPPDGPASHAGGCWGSRAVERPVGGRTSCGQGRLDGRKGGRATAWERWGGERQGLAAPRPTASAGLSWDSPTGWLWLAPSKVVN